MKTNFLKTKMAVGLALATLAGGVASADARGFGHSVYRHGGFDGGSGHRGFGDGRFGHGRFGHYRRFHHRGFRQRFGGLPWGSPVSDHFLGSYVGACRPVYSSLFGGYEYVCG
jgi:hypothetical protein